MATSRQRFLDTLEFKPVAKPWVRWGAFLWDETVERWRQEGWDGTPLDDYFDLDRLVRVDPWYGPVPAFAHEVISEDADTVTYVNHEGIVMREFKQHHDMSMPQFVKFPVENEAEFEQFAAERLALNAAAAFVAAVATTGRHRASPGGCRTRRTRCGRIARRPQRLRNRGGMAAQMLGGSVGWLLRFAAQHAGCSEPLHGLLRSTAAASIA